MPETEEWINWTYKKGDNRNASEIFYVFFIAKFAFYFNINFDVWEKISYFSAT